MGFRVEAYEISPPCDVCVRAGRRVVGRERAGVSKVEREDQIAVQVLHLQKN